MTAQAKTLGIEIASILNSETLTRQQNRKLFETTMPAVLAANAQYQEIERAYPGFTAHIIGAMRPEIDLLVVKRLPALWAQLGDIYSANMTEQDMRSAVDFYRTPTGVWLIDQISSNADLTGLLEKGLADPERKIEGTDVNDAFTKPGIKALSTAMTPDRTRDILRFGLTPAGQKLRRLAPALQQASAVWANDNQADSARMEEIVTKAATEFIERADKANPGGNARAAVKS